MPRFGMPRKPRREDQGKPISQAGPLVAGGLARERQVVLITRAGCHLCQDAEAVLTRLAAELGFSYRTADVDADPALRAEYADRVPVILIDGKEHGYWRVEEARFRRAIERGARR